MSEPETSFAPSGLITLLSDFSDRDWYVGVMKGVILNRNSRSRIVDITHHISPGDIESGSFVWAQAAPFFPAGTVHLAVVDPGVGSSRAILIFRANQQLFVAPDNGLLSRIAEDYPSGELFKVRNSKYFLNRPSHTFHGRDIFAPLAAALSSGVNPSTLGPQIKKMVVLSSGAPRILPEGGWLVPILYVDYFGNLITALKPGQLGEIKAIELDGLIIKRGRSYCEVSSQELLALEGSGGYLEISVNGASASERLGLKAGDLVRVRVPR